MQTNNVSCFRYKLPLTLTDSSGSLDAIAFSKVAKDLVERLAEQACMNMKIEAEDHVVTLDNAIGKERVFYIGMNTEMAGKYPISYVLKKSFPLPNTDSVPMLTAPEVCNIFILVINYKYPYTNLTCQTFPVST
jgi:replication factor A1